MLNPIKEGARNPLTVVADGHQRIYKSNVPLSRAGIEVIGRSKRLKINYRTTEQIRACAQRMLNGVEVDDLDGGRATTAGDPYVVKGPEPKFCTCSGPEQEAKTITDWVKGLIKEGYATHEICVAPNKANVRSALSSARIPTMELQPDASDPVSSEAGVRLGSLYPIKGLEFKAIGLGLTGESVSNTAAGNELQAKRQRCLRYVATTRARERLLVCLNEKE